MCMRMGPPGMILTPLNSLVWGLILSIFFAYLGRSAFPSSPFKYHHPAGQMLALLKICEEYVRFQYSRTDGTFLLRALPPHIEILEMQYPLQMALSSSSISSFSLYIYSSSMSLKCFSRVGVEMASFSVAICMKL